MLVTEIVAAARHIAISPATKNLTQLYVSLANLLTQAIQMQPAVPGSPPRPPSPRPVHDLATLNQQLLATRDATVQAHLVLEPPPTWNSSTRRAFEELGAASVIGAAGAEALSRVFERSVTDFNAMYTGVKTIQDQITAVIQRAGQLLALLGSLALSQPNTEPSDKPAAVAALTFTRGTSIKTIGDMREQSAAWEYIFLNFARLAREPLESPRLLDVRRGSIILEIAAGIGGIAALAAAANNLASIRVNVLNARKLALEVRQLQEKIDMANADTSARDIDSSADAHVEKAATKEAQRLLDAYGWVDLDADGNEFSNLLRDSIRKLDKFYADGGRIEFRFPANDTSEENRRLAERASRDVQQVAENLAQIEKIASVISQMRQLPPKTDGDGGGDGSDGGKQ